MAITHFIETADGKVNVWRIAGDEVALFNKKYGESEAAGKAKHPRTSLQRCASRLLLAEMLGSEPQLDKDPSGKPRLVNSGLNVSISHTDGYAAVMLGKGPVAVDVQAITPRILRLRERYLKPGELLMAQDAEMATLLWAAKETAYKFHATDGHDFRAPICIHHITDDTIWATLQAAGTVTRLTLGYRWLTGAVLVFLEQADMV
jgi:4'-phosphopantetheinyl transferase EntD